MIMVLTKTQNSVEYQDDQHLARRCASGEELAMRMVFATHEPRLRKLLYRNLGNREDAEELASATFLNFWKSAHRYRGTCSLKSFLTRIALNLCTDLSRKRPKLGPEVQCSPKGEHPLAERIRQGLLDLEREDRELLSLYYLNEWDYEEICSSLEITYDVLKTRLVRARKKLRILLGEQS